MSHNHASRALPVAGGIEIQQHKSHGMQGNRDQIAVGALLRNGQQNASREENEQGRWQTELKCILTLHTNQDRFHPLFKNSATDSKKRNCRSAALRILDCADTVRRLPSIEW
jgi:hypothetical protein